MVLLITSGMNVFAQDKSEEENVRKCIVGVWPTGVDQVNGLMFNFWPKDVSQKKLKEGTADLPTTNGLEINLNPLGPFAAGAIFFYHFIEPKTWEPVKDTMDMQVVKNFKKINGVQIAFLNIEPTVMNGIEIHMAGSYGTLVNGVSVGLIVNKRYRLNGLGVAVVGNHDAIVNGVQVGLFNTASKLKGFQFGLWNKNEKRSLPFINWNF